MGGPNDKMGSSDSVTGNVENPAIEVRRIKNATIPEAMRVRPLQREEFKLPNLDEIKLEQQKWFGKEECINTNSKDW